MKETLFIFMNICLILLTVKFTANRYKLRFKETWYWYPLALFFGPLIETICIGQINTFPMFFFFMMYIWENKHPFGSGIFLSAAVLTKVSPAIFLLYLFAKQNIRGFLGFLAGGFVISLLTIYQFGFAPLQKYPQFFFQLNHIYEPGDNSQALISKLSRISIQNKGLDSSGPTQNGPLQSSVSTIPADLLWVPLALTLYALVVMALSGIIVWINREGEPMFIICSLLLTVVPSIVWSHHYVFWIPAIFVWMAWSKTKKIVVLWCLAGFLLIQFDRWLWTYGLLAQIYAHISILSLLAYQIIKIKSQLAFLRLPSSAEVL